MIIKKDVLKFKKTCRNKDDIKKFLEPLENNSIWIPYLILGIAMGTIILMLTLLSL